MSVSQATVSVVAGLRPRRKGAEAAERGRAGSRRKFQERAPIRLMPMSVIPPTSAAAFSP